MDILKKVETLLNASARSAVPYRRQRKSVLDIQEEKVLAEIREALDAVEAQERVLAKRIKIEQAEAEESAQQGDYANQRAHQRRADELERELKEESIQAINLEEALQGLEEKLALAKEAVDKQADIAAAMDEAAEQTMAAHGEIQTTPSKPTTSKMTSEKKLSPADFPDDEPDMANRKSRLAE